MTETIKPQIGGLEPKYGFIINPYLDYRASSCPFCGRKTGQRKLPLLVNVNKLDFVILNYTCRYCKDCDVLIAHKHEIEHLLTVLFQQRDPELIGSDYLVFGTMDKETWREGSKHETTKTIKEIVSHLSDFTTYYKELRMTQQGWYLKGKRPPIRKPPASQEWVKSER